MSDDNDSVARFLRTKSAEEPGLPDHLLRQADAVARATCRAEARSRTDAEIEELVQDVLEVVWFKAVESDETIVNFDSWVRKIARYVCLNARRKRSDVLTEDGVVEATDPTHSVLRDMQRAERSALVKRAIADGLSGLEQDVLFHRYVHELSREEIAGLLGIGGGDNAVRAHLVRARNHLKAAILRRLAELDHSESFLRSEAPSS